MTRVLPLVAVLAVLAAGCGSGEEAARSDRCVDRFTMQRLEPGRRSNDELRQIERYLRITYCDRFAHEGWVHEDGTLSIDVHRQALGWGTEECLQVDSGAPAQTTPCPEAEAREHDRRLDCAVLHHVRRDEVQAYLRELAARLGRAVVCDDGTPLAELGAEPTAE